MARPSDGMSKTSRGGCRAATSSRVQPVPHLGWIKQIGAEQFKSSGVAGGRVGSGGADRGVVAYEAGTRRPRPGSRGVGEVARRQSRQGHAGLGMTIEAT